MRLHYLNIFLFSNYLIKNTLLETFNINFNIYYIILEIYLIKIELLIKNGLIICLLKLFEKIKHFNRNILLSSITDYNIS